MFASRSSGNSDNSPDRHIYGTMIGMMTDNVNPEGEYKVRVRFPTLPGDGASWWCRISTYGASKNGMGMFMLPEIDDEVLVVFNNGDVQQGIIIGTLWNGVDKPAYSNKDASSKTDRFQSNDAKFRGPVEAKKNDIRSFSSRQKHELVFNDNKTDPRVVLSSGQKHRIVLDDKGGAPTQIEIYDGKEENYILIDTKNKKITLETKTGDILLKAKKKITLDCEDLETKSSKTTKMTVGSDYEMKASGKSTIHSNGEGEVSAGAKLTVKGSTVNIN